MAISPLAGNPKTQKMLIDVARLEREFFECQPDLRDAQKIVNGELSTTPE